MVSTRKDNDNDNDMDWTRKGFSTRAGLDIVAHVFVYKNGDRFTAICGGKRRVPMQATCENWHEAIKVAVSRVAGHRRARAPR